MEYLDVNPIQNLVNNVVKKTKKVIAGPDPLTFYGNQYSVELYRKDIRKQALWVAKHLEKVLQHFNADSVAVTGHSGIIVASAALMLVDFPLMIVRKEGEETHGFSIEGRGDHHYRKYIILDDFVSTGNTVRNIETRITKRAHNNDQVCELMAVLCYNSNEDIRSKVEVGEGKLVRKVPIIGRNNIEKVLK